MKKNYIPYTLILFLAFSLNIKSQVVNIPDSNFKNVLLQGQSGINTNGDNEIQISEAIAFTGTIDCNSQNIQDLTGIEAFVNLKKLYCYGNQLTNLDLSQNIALEELLCFVNQLTTLDLSKNVKLISVSCYNNQLQNINIKNCIKLTSFGCGGNQLTNLDVSKNVDLKNLFCDSNQLTNLDISKNLALERLECFLNQITSLDLSMNIFLNTLVSGGNQLKLLNVKNGHNNLITNFSAINNQNLLCIQVDNVNYSTNNPSWYKDSFANYNTNCNYMNVNDIARNKVDFYPNPVTDFLNIRDMDNFKNAEIFSTSGQLIKSYNSKKINLSTYPKGIYIIKVFTSEKTISGKIIKQ